MNKLILIFAFIGITATHSAKAQENIRDKFLVDKIYSSNSNGLVEYIYDVDNKLIKTISTCQGFEQGQSYNYKEVDIFEYENGRVSKIIHYDSSHFKFNYDIYFLYNTEGQLIRSENYMDGSMYKHLNYHYENGRVASAYLDGVMPFQYDSIFYDNAGNVTRRSYYSWGIDGLTWYTDYYEYDNNPRPNLGIDYLFVYPAPIGGSGETLNEERGLSQNNMTKGVGYIWIYTYNEYGLPETFISTWESNNPPLDPLVITIVYREIGAGIIEPVQPKFVVHPNPTNGQLRITNYELRENSTVEVYDVMGRKQYVGTNLRVCPNETRLDISHLPAGVYFLRVDGETVKVIKN